MAQRPADLTPFASTHHFFGAELRQWRQRRGFSLARLGRAVFASSDLIAKIEKAQRWPSENLVARCDEVLSTGGVLPRLYNLAARERRDPDFPPGVDSLVPPMAVQAPGIVVLLPVLVSDPSKLPYELGRLAQPWPSSADAEDVGLAVDAANGVVDFLAVRHDRLQRAAQAASAHRSGRS